MLRFKVLADCQIFVHGKSQPVHKGDEFDVGLYDDDTTCNWISSLLASKVLEIVGWIELEDELPDPEEKLLRRFPPQYLEEPTKKELSEGVAFDRLDFVE